MKDKTLCFGCPRLCGVNRSLEKGFCGIGLEPVVAKAFAHFGEEPCISGTRGSGTVFFSGCSLNCCFCQNHDISLGNYGISVTVQRLAEIFLELQSQGVHNINLVNPTHQGKAVKAALAMVSKDLIIPVVWNSGGYDLPETIEDIAPYVDIWLPDMKYYSPLLSGKLARAKDYFLVASKAIERMVEFSGKTDFCSDGTLKTGVIVRHLILPGYVQDSLHILEWFAKMFQGDVMLSIMAQYTPMSGMTGSLARSITEAEFHRVLDKMQVLGICHGYMQELSATGTTLIPVFDGCGVLKEDQDGA